MSTRFIQMGALRMMGKPGAKTKFSHPYNYDPFVLWSTGKKGNGSAYSDRIWQWDPKKHDEFCEKYFGNRGHYWDRRDPEKIELFLRDYFEYPDLELVEVQEHCNVATGYPLWLFIWRRKGAGKFALGGLK